MKHGLAASVFLGVLGLGPDLLAQHAFTPPDPDGLLQESDRRGHRHFEMQRWHGTARLFFGGKALDEDDWEPVEAQSEFAILTDFAPESWGIRLAADLRFAVSDEEDIGGLDAVSASWELNLGIRKVFETDSPVWPFIGGGMAFGGAELDIEIDDDSDSGVGFWFDVGVDFSLGGPVSVGLEMCYSTIPIDIADTDTDAGGFRFGLTIGFSW